jgi:lipopolysaccharide transport system permease protein
MSIQKKEMSQKIEFDLIIEPGRSKINYWKDIWHYRELFYFLAWRDILVRYKQTVIGLSWSLIRPLLTMVIFTFVFGRLAKLPSNGVPYPILVFSALLPWQFFSTSFTEVSNSLIGNTNMLTKIYFPRVIIPVSTVIVNFVDFLVSFVILCGLMIGYHFVPSWNILFMPLYLVLVLLISMGAGFYIAAVNVKYRDFRYIVPFIVQLGLYISPVGFSISVVPERWKLLYSLNPMVGVIEGFRWSIIVKSDHIYFPALIMSIVISILLFILGIWYFRKVERNFADII